MPVPGRSPDPGKDQVVIYPICVSCYTRAVYIPEIKKDINVVNLFN